MPGPQGLYCRGLVLETSIEPLRPRPGIIHALLERSQNGRELGNDDAIPQLESGQKAGAVSGRETKEAKLIACTDYLVNSHLCGACEGLGGVARSDELRPGAQWGGAAVESVRWVPITSSPVRSEALGLRSDYDPT